MRTLRYLGVALLVAGGLVVLAPTGAFDASDADRGLAVEAAGDATAALGIDYASPDRVVRLESQDAVFGTCFSAGCFYFNEQLLVLEDNTAAGELTVSNITFQESGDDITLGVTNESHPSGIAAVEGDFECPSQGSFPADQLDAQATITMDVTVTDGDVTVDLSREVVVVCVADT